ncbi:MAG: transglutaminase-like domain-containing protein [Chitinispirillaceae bacterium]|jgi:transglutaminase-like putative cysteine protease|nr:transglutaminase-like domain-containing protein [Chitinispirillaceae bacterium]
MTAYPPKSLSFTTGLLAHLFASIAALSAVAGTDWHLLESRDSLDLYLNNQLAGTLVTKTVVDDSSRSITVMSRLFLLPGRERMDLDERRTYGFDGTLVSARQTLKSDAGTSSWELVKKENFREIKTTAGGTQTSRPVSSVTENLSSILAVYHGIRTRSLKPGDSVRDAKLELVSGQTIDVKTACIQTPGPVNRYTWLFVNTSSLSGRSERWVLDTNGSTLELEVWPFLARKAGQATPKHAKNPAQSLFETFAVEVSRPARDNETIQLTFDSAGSPDTSVQRFYRREKNSWQLKAPPAPLLPKEITLRFTSATTTMQSDAPALQLIADSLGATTASRHDSIAALNRYVFTSLDKRYTPTFSSALETLSAGFGDCGEHAVLLGALLRAEQIPARIVLGLIYQNQRYFYHAWVMVLVDNAWQFADPAFGIFPATRDRVPLIIDDSGSDVVRLVKDIGRIRINYVKVPRPLAPAGGL